MRMLLVIMFLGLTFIACDYAKEATELNPDIEITYMDPMGWYTVPGDTIAFATIEETHFVAENSMDCYLRELIFEYYDKNDNLIFQSEPLALYAKINGKMSPTEADTFILYNVSLPLDTAVTYLTNNHLASVKALLHYVASDEYFDKYDTTTVWFGIYMFE